MKAFILALLVALAGALSGMAVAEEPLSSVSEPPVGVQAGQPAGVLAADSQMPAVISGNTSAASADENGFYRDGPVYVSDRANVWIRSGPGHNYRILGARHVGDRMTFVRYSDNSKFVEVRDGDETFWMQTMDVQAEPCGKSLTDSLKAETERLKEEIANYDSEAVRQYNAAARRLERLERENDGMKKAIEEKDNTIRSMDEQLRRYADKLETKELDMQMRWWMQGAIIALCGAVIGIFIIYIPRPNRQKKRDRF